MRKINIQNWGTPVVKQYGISSIPHVLLYNPGGTLEKQGQQAIHKVLNWGK